MKKQFIKTLFSIVTLAIFMVGCGSSSATSTEITANEEVNLTEEYGIIDGEVGDTAVIIPIKTDDGQTTVAEVTLAAGTTFEDENGEPIAETPTLIVKAEQETESTSSDVSFKVGDKVVIPTKDVTISILAPDGAKDGEYVEIEVDDGVTDGFQKVTKRFLVKNGRVSIVIQPSVFRINIQIGYIRFVIKIQTVTGAQ